MLRPCTEPELDTYMDFAYALATDPATSGYPTYCDGVKTREMFVERTRAAFARETEEILLFVYEGKVEGWIHYYCIPEDHYLATNSCNIRRATETALAEFLAYVGERYAGYDLFLGFPAENTAAVRFLADQGFACIEDDYNNTAFLDKGDWTAPTDLIRVNRENYDLFRTLHRQIEDDMYWNSARILADLDNWVIFVGTEDGVPQGAVYYMDEKDDWFEIFGVDLREGVFQEELFRKLLYAALADAKRRGGRTMSFFCEEEGEKTAVACGFTCVGRYLCYKTHLA